MEEADVDEEAELTSAKTEASGTESGGEAARVSRRVRRACEEDVARCVGAMVDGRRRWVLGVVDGDFESQRGSVSAVANCVLCAVVTFVERERRSARLRRSEVRRLLLSVCGGMRQLSSGSQLRYRYRKWLICPSCGEGFN